MNLISWWIELAARFWAWSLVWAGFSLCVSTAGTALQVTYSIHLGTEPISVSLSQVDGVALLSPCPCHSLQLAIEGKLRSPFRVLSLTNERF